MACSEPANTARNPEASHRVAASGRIRPDARRRRGNFLVSLVWLFFLVSPTPAADGLQGFAGCVWVEHEWADGDSFRVRLPDKRELVFRLYGVDCLEIHVQGDDTNARRLRDQRRYFGIADIQVAKRHGETALAMVKEKLSRPFTVHSAFADGRGDPRFQRFYAFVTTADGDDLGTWLVSQGLARAFGVVREMADGTTAREYEARLEDLELAAAKRGRGAWASTDWDHLPEERRAAREEARELEMAKGDGGNQQPVDPNTAAMKEIEQLPGVGPTRAKEIIQERVNGRYEKAEDLLRVQGIGAKTLGKFKHLLVFPPAHPVP